MSDSKCSVARCKEKAAKRDYCNKHYIRWRRHGSPFAGPPERDHSDLPGERWLPIAGFEGLYDISDRGRVRSLPQGGRKAIIRSLSAPPAVHYRVRLHRDRKATTHLVHQLVAAAFIGPRPEGLEVRHLDGDHHNNVPSNLCYGTHTENMQDVVRHGKHYEANQTHCKRRHEFTAANTYINPSSGSRACRTCRAINQRESRTRLRGAALAA